MKQCVLILAILTITAMSCKKTRQPQDIRPVNQKEILKEFTFLGRALGLVNMRSTVLRAEETEYRISSFPVGLIIGDSGRQVRINLHNARVSLQRPANGDEILELKNEAGPIATLKFTKNRTKGRLKIHRRGALRFSHPSTQSDRTIERPTLNRPGFNDDNEFDFEENLDLLTTEELELLITVSALHAELNNTSIVRFEEQFGFNVNDALTRGGPCRWTVINIGGTEGIAGDRTTREVNKFLGRHPDCKTVRTPTTGCLWGGFYCVSVQELECVQFCPLG